MSPTASVVHGAVLTRSATRVAVQAGVAFVIAIVAIVLLWDRHGLPSWTSVPLGLVALAAPLALFTLIGELASPRRYVFGADLFQEVRGGRRQRVSLQIPYANIAEVRRDTKKGRRRLALEIRREDDPKSFVRAEASGSREGSHVFLEETLHVRLDAILEALESSRARWRAREEASSRVAS